MLKPGKAYLLDGARARAYRHAMKDRFVYSFWRPWIVAIFVAMLVFAPVLQGHAPAAHPNNFDVQLQHEHADTQRANCCVDGENPDHALDAECSSCILPCMSTLHSLLPDPTLIPFFLSVPYLLSCGQILGGLAAAPDLRPPKTRS
ncbi:hypothetical protein [Blastomonas fulva]|uniref:hypothetical protein n=1 Tax=Blastomonas fulva TaxID=1550728 RepID=UPI003D268101